MGIIIRKGRNEVCFKINDNNFGGDSHDIMFRQ